MSTQSFRSRQNSRVLLRDDATKQSRIWAEFRGGVSIWDEPSSVQRNQLRLWFQKVAMTTGLTIKEKALVGIGAAVASGCQPCTARYVQAARTAGACERSIRLAIETGIAERQKATDAMAEWARSVQGAIPVVDESFRAEKRKNTVLIAGVAAHVIHSTAALDANLSQALALGWSVAQVGQALGVGRSTADVAAQNADAVIAKLGIVRTSSTGSHCDGAVEHDAPVPGSSGCGCTSGCSGA